MALPIARSLMQYKFFRFKFHLAERFMPSTRVTPSTGMAHVRNTSIRSSSQKIPRSLHTLHDMLDPWLRMFTAQCSMEVSSATQPTASQRTASCESFTSASQWLSWWNKLEDAPPLAGRECLMFSLRPFIPAHQFFWAAGMMCKTSRLSTRPRLKFSWTEGYDVIIIPFQQLNCEPTSNM